MRRALFLLAPALIGGCSMNGAEADPAATAAAAGAPVDCVDVDQIVARRPAGRQSLVFELTGGRTYRNDLPDHCPALENWNGGDIVAVEVNGGQLCRNDRARIFDPVEARNIGAQAFPTCRLGAFTPVASDRRNH